jgi:hypothetical protein
MPWRSRTSVTRGSPALQVLVGPRRRPKPRIKLMVSFYCLLVGLAPLVDFDDHNKLLGVTIRNRCRRAPARVISWTVASMSPEERLRL